MFLGLQWQWWLVIVVVIFAVPLKVKLMKRWGKHQQQNKSQKGKWGEEE